MVHIAISGTGRVGSVVAYTTLFERYVTELSLADVAPEVARMTREELSHAIAGHGFDVKINAYDQNRRIENADLIIIAAGFARTPDMSRRDLATKNAGIVHGVVKDTLENNPRAWYFVITNPVDAMTTLANRAAEGKRQVIGTGTNLETSRFRTILARELEIPISSIEAYVGGEHGEAAVLLWSTVRVDGTRLDDYLIESGKSLDKARCENYVKEVSREIIRVLGGTRFGPAWSFIEIIRGVLLNTGKIACYSRPRRFEGIPESVYLTIPGRISKSLGPDIWGDLSATEQDAIQEAAKAIYTTYLESKEGTH